MQGQRRHGGLVRFSVLPNAIYCDDAALYFQNRFLGLIRTRQIKVQKLDDIRKTQQFDRLAGEGVDDFAHQSVDSTSVEASSAWPTDSKLIYKVLRRAVSMSARLEAYGFADLSSKCIERWLKDIRKADLEITMASGKAGAGR